MKSAAKVEGVGAARSEGSGVFASLRSPVLDAAMRDGEEGVSHGGLSMARYVAVGALLRAFPRPRKGEVLAKVGLDDKDWERARACWMAALRANGDEAAALLESWSTAFDRAWETLQADPPSMEDLDAARARKAAPADVPTYLREGAVEPARVENKKIDRLQATMPSVGAPRTAELPFKGKIDAPRPRATRVPMTMRSKETGTLETKEPLVRGAQILPFRGPKSAPVDVAVVEPSTPAPVKVDLTVEQYASLTVELAFWPDARAATLARYGIADEDAFARLEADWRPRIAWEPGVVARWSEACRAYRAWLVERAQAPK